ncbi:uncharacterized protein LAESUDRAFT_735379 [Laetiporus sulphureus 93-53]|uniref:Monopolin complex subunit Csm1/Pcs1 C-terminal domain-containing protein n=1 Tax=Laetiporus sulphureus 93-53 TaxID=1314785 RepID=A0A165G2D1_9APHY|nr:uncharacterized protein LAESUDRAFT_735379 [Laetiporus sulphureus 93-53]KZT09736.1 hypothetical protein LAESUDRAFT_735379 [Laetiporus sulphureus 93-53]
MAKKTAPKRPAKIIVEHEEIIIESSSSEHEHGIETTQEGSIVDMAGSSKTAPRKAPGRAGAAASGKAKSAVAKGKARAVEHEEMDVDEVLLVDDDRPSRTKPIPKVSKANAVSIARLTREKESLSREVDRLRKNVDSLNAQVSKYEEQLEELFHIRETEAEQNLREQAEQYEAKIQTQEALIKELTSQLTKTKALGASAKASVVQFLTREAADEEKLAVEREVERCRDIIKNRDQQLAEKDKRIQDLEVQETILRSDLAAEIERGNHLSKNPPPPSARTHTKPPDDPKNALVIRLYEDMTNCLIVSAKVGKSAYFNLDEPVFSCVYTHRDPDSDVTAASVNFSLREIWEKPEGSDPDSPVKSKDDLVMRMKYQPYNLENEPEEFVKALKFLGHAFIFARDQLPIFLKSLTENVDNAVRGAVEEDMSEGEEVVGMEEVVQNEVVIVE